MRITRALAATLAVSLAVIIAPAAQSRPHAQAQPPDMHASVALAAAASRRQQDLRSADAHDAAVCPRNNALTAGASSEPPTARAADVANGLGIVAALFVLGGLAAFYGRRGHRSQRLRAGH